MVKRAGVGLVFGVFAGCGSENPSDKQSTVSPTGGDSGGTSSAASNSSATSNSSAASTSAANAQTNVEPNGAQGLDSTALLQCAAGQVPCNQKCLSPGESSLGCTHVALIELSSDATYHMLQGFDLRADSLYVGLLSSEAPDVIRVFDKATGAVDYEVPGAGGTLQQVAVTDTHLGWTENMGGTLDLYSAPLGETQPTLLYSVTANVVALPEISAIPTGWVVAEPGQLVVVPEDGSAPQTLSVEGDVEGTAVERNGKLYYRTMTPLEPDQVWSVPLSGGEATLLGEVGRVDVFHADESDLYLIESEGGASDPRYISRLSLLGGAPERISAQIDDGLAFTLAGYGDFLYAPQSVRIDPADNSAGYIARLVRVTKSTGAQSVIAVTEHDVSNVFVDATGIYFTRLGDEGQSILRMQ